ncbi:MAG: TonB-dependent receptor, partial [Chitinophagaceae bacterium]|nr:TonB-dependent receptor [Chitinophagaceae bacterium]
MYLFKYFSFFLSYFIFCTTIKAQINTDSTYSIPEVIVNIYPTKIPLFRSPSSVGILNEAQLSQQPGYTLVPALNSIAGVRMEERSPGSYRLSVRGSLLRSPFGI